MRRTRKTLPDSDQAAPTIVRADATKPKSLRTRAGSRTSELIRDVIIENVRPFFSLSSARIRQGSNDEKYHRTVSLQLRGKLTEAIRGSVEAKIVVYLSDKAKIGSIDAPTAIGMAGPIRPLHVALFIERPEFDALWTFALSGALSHGRIHMTPPQHQAADVLYLGLSSDPIE